MQIVLSLSPITEHIYLPTACLVEEDEEKGLTHVLRKATLEVVASYGISLPPGWEKLLRAAEALSASQLEKKFKPSRARTATPLKTLLTQESTRKAVETYIYHALSQLLADAVNKGMPIAFQAERSALVQKTLLTPVSEPLVPHLFFRKTEHGIEYRLTLGTDTEQWAVGEHGVIPLTNTDPAWVAVRQQLFQVPGINGNMLRPFTRKTAVKVPAEQVKMYFQRFILKAASRAHVEAEGFEVRTVCSVQGGCIELIDNPFQEGVWKFGLFFFYEGVRVAYADRRTRITSLLHHMEGGDEVSVQVVQRNTAEEEALVRALRRLGFREENRYFYLPGYSHLSDVLDWLLQHRELLEAAGVQITAPMVAGRCLALLPHELTFTSAVAGDWFDVHGEVRIGSYSIPFRDFVPYLRSGNPYYPLDDSLYFRIPETWFEQYGTLAQHLHIEGQRLRLPKTLYALLGLPNSAQKNDNKLEFRPPDPESIAYAVPDTLKADLRPYQLYGVKWLIAHEQQGFGACLADDMGLGKTLQTIAFLLYLKQQDESNAKESMPYDQSTTGVFRQLSLFDSYQMEIRPLQALIILPTSLVFNWKRELERFAPSLFVYTHTGPGRSSDLRAIAGHDVVLTTYHTARQDLALLKKLVWRAIVLDESQQIKNRASEISKVVRSLQGRFKLSLSGTPIENALADLWTQMEFINPETLGSFREFRERFLIPIEKQKDEAAKQRLFEIVRPFFLRRTKEEVAPDLPPLSEQEFYSEMAPEQYQVYERTKSAMRNEILRLFDNPQTKARALNELMRLRQIANHPALVLPEANLSSGKFEDVLFHWENARRAGHKVLFFSSFEKHLRLFRQHFKAQGYAFAWLTGEIAEKERADEVMRFQNDPTVQAFFMTLKAGGVGLNLTAADYVFILDPWWNPAMEEQAVARAHRIGQERPVTVMRFIARRSIEEKILDLQKRKKQLRLQFFAISANLAELSREDVELLLE